MQCSTVKLKEGGPQEASLKGVKGCKDCTRWYASSAEAPRYTTWKMPICVCNTGISPEIIATYKEKLCRQKMAQAEGITLWGRQQAGMQSLRPSCAKLRLYEKKQPFYACSICVSQSLARRQNRVIGHTRTAAFALW